MAYGDKMTLNKIKSTEIIYEEIKKDTFNDNSIQVYLENKYGWYSMLEFQNRKEWFNFVRTINKLNKQFKKMKNIEKTKEDN